MTVYVDNERIPWRGRLWCHLVADSLDELHQFAARLGLKRVWFQGMTPYPHYDVTMSVRERALFLGALPARKRQMVACASLMRDELRASLAAAATQSVLLPEPSLADVA